MMFINAPIAVLACSYITSQTSFNEDGVSAPHAWVRIAYANTASMPIRSVRFDVGNGRVRQTVDDAGTFSPLVVISHDLAAAPDAFLNGAQKCSIDEVTYADGSHWKRR
jgi:hypothetical protein